MKVLDVRHIEDCLDGSYVRELVLDLPTDRPFINHLGRQGRLCYYGEFARPFFTVVDTSRFKLKGVEGDRTLTLVGFADDSASLLSWLSGIVAQYAATNQAAS